jgi:hypothetical protein
MVRSRCWTLGLNTKVERWDSKDIEALKAAYASASGPVRLRSLAKVLGRHRGNVCRKARELGLTNKSRVKLAYQQKSLDFTLPMGHPELAARVGRATKRRIARKGHPRGMLGKHHTDEAKAKMAAGSSRAWADPAHRVNSPEFRQRLSDLALINIAAGKLKGGYTRSAGGKRTDLGGRYFRSAWEANYARYLEWRKARGDLAAWEFEAKTFVFEAIRRGTRAYTPDFMLTFPDGRVEWHEVKGWMDPKSKTRLDRMAKFFPTETVRIIGEDWFRMAKRTGLSAMIPGWERGRKRGSRGC